MILFTNISKEPSPHTYTTEQRFNRTVVLRESQLRLLTESDMYDYVEEYTPSYILEQFLEQGCKGRMNWGPLINPAMYQQALAEFTRYGRLVKFPPHYVYQWMGIIMRNTALLGASTQICGHANFFPLEELESFFSAYYGKDVTIYKSDYIQIPVSKDELYAILYHGSGLDEGYAVHKGGQLNMFLNQDEVDEWDKRKEFEDAYGGEVMNDIEAFNSEHMFDMLIFEDRQAYHCVRLDIACDRCGLYNYLVLPDGSDAISDYGLEPLYTVLNEYNDEKSPEETLVLVNRALDVYHQRGDLCSAFVQGGSKGLLQASEGLGAV